MILVGFPAIPEDGKIYIIYSLLQNGTGKISCKPDIGILLLHTQ